MNVKVIQLCGECGADEATSLGICRKCSRAYLVVDIVNGDIPTYNEDNECNLCGEHVSNPHHPECEIALREDSESAAIKHYFLVSYNAVTGDWEIDDDAAFFPDKPVYEGGRFRKLTSGEIDHDKLARNTLKKVLKGMNPDD